MSYALNVPVAGYLSTTLPSPAHSEHSEHRAEGRSEHHSAARAARAEQGGNDRLRESAGTNSSSQLRIGAAERFKSAESFSLSLQTRDGDTVTIAFSREDSYRARFAAGVNRDGEQSESAARFSIDRQHSSEFGFTVEGELDSDEIDAITRLIQDVALLAEDFFSGNLQQAFERSTQLSLDGGQLASLSLSMEQSQQYSAVATYRDVQAMGSSSHGARSDRMLQTYTQQLVEQASQAQTLFADAGNATQSLMRNLVQQDSRYLEVSQREQLMMNRNLSMVESLIGDVSATQSENRRTDVQEDDVH